MQAVDAKRMERWIHQYWARNPWQSQNGEGEDSNQLLVQALFRENGFSVPLEKVKHISEQFLATYQPRVALMRGVIEVLTSLKQKEKLLGVLSNRYEISREELASLGLSDFLDYVISAGSVGYWKPDPKVFHGALQRCEVSSPQDVLYVGDNYYADIVGAKGAGIDALLFDDRRVYADADCRIIRDLVQVADFVDGTLPEDALEGGVYASN